MFSITYNCVICNKNFVSVYSTKPSKNKRKKKTCSSECHKKLMSIIQNEKVEVSCLNCNKKFKIKRSRMAHKRGKYCCRKCFCTHRKLMTPCVTLICKECKKEFSVNEKRFIYYRKKYGNSVFSYCSRKCHLKSNGKTNIESIVENILINNNIDYAFDSFKLDNFTYDFHIKNTNILIECDGEYWHNKNQIMDSIKDLNVKSITNKDLRKTLTSIKNNFILLRFKEFEIMTSPEIIEEIIKTTLKNIQCLNSTSDYNI